MRNNLKFAIYLSVLIAVSTATAGPKEDFFKAIEIDAPIIVNSLLKQDFDPNQRDDQGQAALYLALRNESYQVAAALLAHPKTEIDLVNRNGETPLMMAALRGNLEWTQRLLERGAQLNREGWTPLHYAASSNEPQVVRLLLDRGASIDARSPNGTTPLMMAARYGAIDAADLLRQRGADASVRNERGLTAADFASGAGRDTLAQRLQVR
jgi:ankyrin repeat protein